ncbi:MAG: FkbM family methyltransferase [Deltaproteobacteria bacterium]|nr:FkbM family methyltransferase [Deltaproteobacteria bacterium]
MTILGYCRQLLTRHERIRDVYRRWVSHTRFYPPEKRYDKRVALELEAPEEDVSTAVGNYTFSFPNKCLPGIYADIYGSFKPKEYDTVIELYAPSIRNVIEVGGNVGIDTIPFCAKFKNIIHYYVFEPHDSFQKFLKKNLETNGFDQLVEIAPYFVSNVANGQQRLYRHFTSASVVQPNYKYFPTIDSQDCPTVTLDDFISEKQMSSLDFLKIDTDGWDQHVLEGAKKSIVKFKPLILIEYAEHLLVKAGNSMVSLSKTLHDLGYDLFVVLDLNGSRIVNEYQKLSEVIDPKGSVDVLAISISR